MMTGDEAASFTELAAAERSQAQEARAQAARTTAAAEAALTEAQEEAARIVADAEEAARQAGAEAAGGQLSAGLLDARAALLDQARALSTQAEAADSRAADLTAERTRLADQADGLDARLAELAADLAGTEAALATALEGGDVDGITAARGRIAAIGEVRDRLSPDRDAARAAVAAIGSEEGPGRLAEVIAAGRARQAELWGALCVLADDEDAPDGVRALAALERDAVAGRARSEAAALSDQIDALRPALSEVLARVPGERTEIERRRDLPFRLVAGRIRLAHLAEAYKRREADLSAHLSAAEDWMTRLAECDPAALSDVLAGGLRCRGQMARRLEETSPPLAPDDLDMSPEAVRAALREEEDYEAARWAARDDAQPRRQVVTR
jgi:hypothetical protein